MKKLDRNGFWRIEGNPITKEGVFKYTGEQLGLSSHKDELFNVYRPASEISKEETVKSFDGVPFIIDHKMLGEGFSKFDDEKSGGVLFNTKYEDGKIIGDLRIFSEEMMKEIEGGKKELSPGYICKYIQKKGTFNGEPYDFVQTNIRGNHLALVDEGRTGHDIRVYDSCRRVACDSVPITKEIQYMDDDKKAGCDEFVDVAQLAKKLASSGLSEEVIKKINDLTESIKYVRNKDSDIGESDKEKQDKPKDESEEKKEDEKSDAKDEEKSDEKSDEKEDKPEEKPEEKKAVGDAEKVDKRKLIDQIGGILKGKVDDEIIRTIMKKAEEIAYNDSEKSGDDEKEEGKGEKDEKEGNPAEDSKMDMKKLLSEISKRDALASRLSSIIGDFEHSEMTVADVADYGVKHLNLNVQKGMEIAALEGYLAGMDSNPSLKKFNTSACRQNSGADEGIINYLKK